MLQRAGIGRNAAGRNRTAAQCPQETLVPVLTLLWGGFHIGQCARDALIGFVDAAVDRFA